MSKRVIFWFSLSPAANFRYVRHINEPLFGYVSLICISFSTCQDITSWHYFGCGDGRILARERYELPPRDSSVFRLVSSVFRFPLFDKNICMLRIICMDVMFILNSGNVCFHLHDFTVYPFSEAVLTISVNVTLDIGNDMLTSVKKSIHFINWILPKKLICFWNSICNDRNVRALPLVKTKSLFCALYFNTSNSVYVSDTLSSFTSRETRSQLWQPLPGAHEFPVRSRWKRGAFCHEGHLVPQGQGRFPLPSGKSEREGEDTNKKRALVAGRSQSYQDRLYKWLAAKCYAGPEAQLTFLHCTASWGRLPPWYRHQVLDELRGFRHYPDERSD